MTYKVGYKKPPQHMRFKKGVCPNPFGRAGKKGNAVAKKPNAPMTFTLTYLRSTKNKHVYEGPPDCPVESLYVKRASLGDASKAPRSLLVNVQSSDALVPIVEK